MAGSRLGIFGNFRSRIKRPPLGVPWAPPPPGETTANFTCWTFVTRLLNWIAGSRDRANTCPYVKLCIFGLKHVFPSYGLDVGDVGLLFLNFLVHVSAVPAEAFGWPDVRKSVSCGLVTQSASVGHLGSARVRSVRKHTISPRGWRRIRW